MNSQTAESDVGENFNHGGFMLDNSNGTCSVLSAAIQRDSL